MPVIYIRAVAVREDWQGRGLSAALVVDALRKCVDIADRIGAAAMVLDVLRDAYFE
nr:GNAT family N-acetyltransferase [Paracoccaceae bacterium]